MALVADMIAIGGAADGTERCPYTHGSCRWQRQLVLQVAAPCIASQLSTESHVGVNEATHGGRLSFGAVTSAAACVAAGSSCATSSVEWQLMLHNTWLLMVQVDLLVGSQSLTRLTRWPLCSWAGGWKITYLSGYQLR